MVKKSNLTISNISILVFAAVLPLSLIIGVAWYLGFIFSNVDEYNDPCVRLYTEDICKNNKKCKWNNKNQTCNLDSECVGASQQTCGEGCHWDATVKRPGSNLYGLCRPATLTSVGDGGGLELK